MSPQRRVTPRPESIRPVRQIDASARLVLISLNPRAGARSGRRDVDQLTEALRGQGLEVQLHTDIHSLSQHAEEASRQSVLRAVVAAGGDGTVSLVTNQTAPGTPIAILPLGTENLLSKYLAIPADPVQVSQIIAEGLTTQLDAGQAGDRLFLLMAGCGFDAEVVHRLHANRSGHIRHLSYAKPIFDAVRSYPYPRLQVYCDSDATDVDQRAQGGDGGGVTSRLSSAADTQLAANPPPAVNMPSPAHQVRSNNSADWRLVTEARWAFIVNLPRYACGLSFAPAASGTDGMLDVCTFRNGSLVSGLRYLGGVILGRHANWRDCQIFRAARIRITAEGQVPIQMDGDPAGHLPVEVCVAPGRLTALVSRRWAVSQGAFPAEDA